MFEPGHEKIGGRKKGSENKTTRTVKEVVLRVFNELQDDPQHSLEAFAKNNPTEFYKIASKLIPTEVKANLEHTIEGAIIDWSNTGTESKS